MNQIWKFLTSLRVTVTLLGLAILLVFFGTFSQVDLGLYQAQDRWFKSGYVAGWFHGIPWIFPGGYTIGSCLLINLVAAHIKRFKWSTSKIGIHLTHLGVIVLLVGQLATDKMAVETRMSFKEGQSSNYVEDHREYELAVARDVEGDKEEVVAIPGALLDPKRELSAPQLPFTIKLKEFHSNAEVRQRAPMVDKGEPPATQGLGPKVTMTPLPEAKDMDTKNLPAAILEIVEKGKSLGTWIVSPFLNPQSVEVDGKSYRVQLRDERQYLPYGITLVKATHKVYPGSDTPKDFRSKVKIVNPQTHEDREVEISMNDPMRYAGLAFFQYQMNKDELDRSPGSSTLMVVRNPSWLAPYIGCILVALGLLWQFLHHLVGFITKRLAA